MNDEKSQISDPQVYFLANVAVVKGEKLQGLNVRIHAMKVAKRGKTITEGPAFNDGIVELLA